MSRAKNVIPRDGAARATLVDPFAGREPRDEAAWITEIEGRARRAISSESDGIDVDAAVDRISRDLGL